MTKLDLALARIARLPPDRQEAVAVQIEELLEDEEADAQEPPAWHLEEVRARQAGDDDFATDAEAEAFFKRHGA